MNNNIVQCRLYDIEGNLCGICAQPFPPPRVIKKFIAPKIKIVEESLDITQVNLYVVEYYFVDWVGHICWYEQKELVKKK